MKGKGLSSLPTSTVKGLVDRLGFRIVSGEFAPGESIPFEAELAAEYSVSRTVVREAIKVLSGKGMVRTARRYGSRVCAYDDWSLLDADVIRWHRPGTPMRLRILRDATVLRFVVEPHAAALAAEYGPKEDRQAVLDAAEAIAAAEGDPARAIEEDRRFHEALLRASGNVVFAQLTNLILELVRSSNVGEDGSGEDILPPHGGRHLAVAKAVIDGDPHEARKRMVDMLQINLGRMNMGRKSGN